MGTLLLISGPVGVGKTTVGTEVSTILDAGGVPHAFIDLDGLACSFPRSATDPYGDGLAFENLAAVWANCQRRGARHLVIARVVESRAYAQQLAKVAGFSGAVVVRLTAQDATLLERVRARELGANLAWHEHRCLELSAALAASALDDFCVATDGRPVADIASEVVQRVTWSK